MRPGFDPWVGKVSWRRERLFTPVFWPREFHGLYSPWGRKESDTAQWLSLSRSLLFEAAGKPLVGVCIYIYNTHTAHIHIVYMYIISTKKKNWGGKMWTRNVSRFGTKEITGWIEYFQHRGESWHLRLGEEKQMKSKGIWITESWEGSRSPWLLELEVCVRIR